MLIKTIAEVNVFAAVNKAVAFESLAPSLELATRRHIIPAIGDALYTELETTYNDSSFSDKQKELIALLQCALVGFALHLYIPQAEVQWTDNGLRRGHSEALPGAYKHQVERLSEHHLSAGLDGLESVLSFLEKNHEDFSTWTDSAEREAYNNLFVRSGAELKAHYRFLRHPWQVFESIRSTVANVETLIVSKVIGAELATLRTAHSAGDASAEQKAAIRLLQPAIVHLALWKALPHLAVRVDGIGITIEGDADTSAANSKRRTASDAFIGRLHDELKETGYEYLGRAVEYIHEHASATVFPAWYAAHPPATARQTTSVNPSLRGSFSFG